MKAFILFDSVYGNTEKIAHAIGDALSPRWEVQMKRVNEFSPQDLSGVDLFIAGSPTRAFRPTPETTNTLKNLPAQCLKGVKVAAFDTRANIEEVGSAFLTFMVRIFGYAAEPIARLLVKKGGTQVTAPAGFFITEKEGPLKEGELERAAEWAKTIQ